MDRTPHQIADDIVIMADEYGKLGERYNEIRKIYALWWETCRPEYKSDKSAEKAWDLTREGQEMSEVSLKMKTHEKKMSAYKSYLRVLETEAKNQF
jgi:hypothetical protein